MVVEVIPNGETALGFALVPKTLAWVVVGFVPNGEVVAVVAEFAPPKIAGALEATGLAALALLPNTLV